MSSESRTFTLLLKIQVPEEQAENFQAALKSAISLGLSIQDDGSAGEVPVYFLEPKKISLAKFITILEIAMRKKQYKGDPRPTLVLNSLQNRLVKMDYQWESLEKFLEDFSRSTLWLSGQKSMDFFEECLADLGLHLGMSSQEYRAVVASGKYPQLL